MHIDVCGFIYKSMRVTASIQHCLLINWQKQPLGDNMMNSAFNVKTATKCHHCRTEENLLKS